ncbi:MAG: hypothetical protein JST38_05525 [Bacteroidetes bacterium]|nr:hypothetical protein [Bacteroidota bacterium]
MQKETFGIWPNMGQVVSTQGAAVPGVKFYTTGAVPRAYFRKDGSFSLVLATGDSLGPDTLRRLDITCVGGNAQYPQPVVWQMKSQYAHFYLPQCGPGGAQFVHPYHRVLYPGVYPHIDMHIYSGKVGQKLAFVINPGGDPKDITLQFQGQEQMDVDIYGNLKLLIAGKWITIPEAMAYQVADNGSIIPVNWTAAFNAYESMGRAYFQFDAYDHAKPLIFLIGPPALGGVPPYAEYGLCWSTYFGETHFDLLTDIKPDDQGNFYVTGRAERILDDFPPQPGMIAIPGQSPSVGKLAKFNLGHELLWTAYIGGSSFSPHFTAPAAIAVKQNPVRIYMVGTTTANNFFTHASEGAYWDQNNNNAQNKGFVARFRGENGQIQWSTYFGSAKVEVQAVDVRPHTDQIVISGITEGILPGALANGYNGGKDAFITLFNEQDDIQWSHYYGGSGDETRALVRANSERLVLAGTTASSNIPTLANVPGESYTESYNGGTDVFIAQHSYGGEVQWATYLGGPEDDQLAPQGLGLNKKLYLTGTCGHLPHLVHGNGWYDETSDASGKNGFIAKFQDGNNADMWISYLGGGTNHAPYCLHVNQGDEVTVGGYTNEAEPDLLQWPGHYYQAAYEPDQGGLAQDCFITRFGGQQNMLWYTLFGGNAGNLGQPQNIRAVHDIGGSVYAVGYNSTPHSAPGSYFPLDGQTDAGYFFNPLYNQYGQVGGDADGFITEFCNEMVTSVVHEPGVAATALRVAWSPSEGLVLHGLSDGLHQVRLYDARGRLVLAQEVPSREQRSVAIGLPQADMAVYMAVVDGRQGVRFIPAQ